MKRQLLISFIAAILAVMTSSAQTSRSSKAWEFGVGGNVQSLSRVFVSDYKRAESNSDILSMDKRDVMFGLNLYVARQLNSHFYVDFQGNFDFSSDPTKEGNKGRTTITPAFGIQWRLGSYMFNKVIDPFVRVGVGYQFRNFSVDEVYDVQNPDAQIEQRNRHASPISFGAGTNLWISNSWGVGLQGDYVLQPQNGIANQWQGTVRVIYRLGGEPVICNCSNDSNSQIEALNKEINKLREQIANSGK